MAQFFRFCAKNDEVTLEDLLLHRYGKIPKLDAMNFIALCERAKEQERREELYKAWIALLPLMQIQEIKYLSFDEYFDKCTGRNIDRRSDAEILAEVERIRAEAGKET